jgi:hypothetical protein
MPTAYNEAKASIARPYYIFAHQDVYLPAGWIDRTIDLVGELTRDHPDWGAMGVYGVRKNGDHVGRVWDVNLRRELGGSGFGPQQVESFDELIFLVRGDVAFRFDEGLPDFHLYGTDLVQDLASRGKTSWAVENPVVHNNRPIASYEGGFTAAYRYARRKWRARLPIYTTICRISFNPYYLWRARWAVRKVKRRPDNLTADAREISLRAGYER